jgi:NAD(P)-dependent dehydrogenase (short-subunit alcohol dehydrogenase family)
MSGVHDGDVVVVTGAGGAIGSAYAAGFLAAGASVALVDISDESLGRLEQSLEGPSERRRSYAVNLTDFGAVADMFARIEKELGPPRVLVNNAGVGKIIPILDVTEADHDWLVDNNLKQAFAVAKEAARLMIRHRLRGSIINIASTAGLRPIAHLTTYSMAKAAIIFMTACMAKEWGTEGINTNCLCPGFIDTPMNHALWETDQGKTVLANLPRGRLGTPEHLVRMVMFLASPGAQFINGAVIPVDDGLQHVFPF